MSNYIGKERFLYVTQLPLHARHYHHLARSLACRHPLMSLMELLEPEDLINRNDGRSGSNRVEKFL